MAFDNDPEFAAEVAGLGNIQTTSVETRPHKSSVDPFVVHSKEIAWMLANRKVWAGWPERTMYLESGDDLARLAHFRARFPFSLSATDDLAFAEISSLVYDARIAHRSAYRQNVAAPAIAALDE